MGRCWLNYCWKGSTTREGRMLRFSWEIRVHRKEWERRRHCWLLESGYWPEGVYLTDRALVLYYDPQLQYHLLIIGLHSLVAVPFLFTVPLPQQSLISQPPSISNQSVHNIDTCILTVEGWFKAAISMNELGQSFEQTTYTWILLSTKWDLTGLFILNLTETSRAK